MSACNFWHPSWVWQHGRSMEQLNSVSCKVEEDLKTCICCHNANLRNLICPLFSMQSKPLEGGAQQPLKMVFVFQVANSIASTLLQEGFELQWVSTNVDKLIDLVGPKHLASTVATPPGPKRYQEILKAFRDCAIDMPQIKPKLSSEASMISKSRKKNVAPSPDEYTVTQGFLLYEDGTTADQRQEFSS